MTNQLFPLPPRAFDRNGDPLAGAKAYVYETGTMTAVTVTDSTGTPLAWPVVADLNGTFAAMFYAGSLELKLIITDSAGLIQPGYPVDPVAIAQSGTFNAAQTVFTPTDQAPSLDVQGAMEDLSTAIEALQGITISAAGLATGGGALTASRTITVTRATTEQAQAGADNATVMTPLRTKSAIEALSPLGKGYNSGNQTITTAGLLTLAHGLGAAPELIAYSLVCLTTEAGWAVGDVAAVDFSHTSTAANRINTAYADATNVYVRFSSEAACFILGNKATGVATGLTNGNWALRVRAWA